MNISMVSSDFVFNYTKNSDTADKLTLLPISIAGIWNLEMSYDYNIHTKTAKSVSNFSGDSVQVLRYLKIAFEMVQQDITPYNHIDVQVSGFPCVAYTPEKLPIDTILNAVKLILKIAE